jgi:hypothetical protein
MAIAKIYSEGEYGDYKCMPNFWSFLKIIKY